MYGDFQFKQLQDFTDFVLHFVKNKMPLKTLHCRGNQVLPVTKELSKVIMTRSRLKKIYLKTNSQEDNRNYNKQGNYCDKRVRRTKF